MPDNASHRTYYLSPSTREEFFQFIESLNSENDNGSAVEAMLRDAYDILIDKTGGLIADAVDKGFLNPTTGAQLSYRDFQYYFKKPKGGKSIGEERWSLPYSTSLSEYRLVGTLMAWQYTQTIVMALPSFNPSKDINGSVVETIPIGLFYSLYGLPMYVPVKAKNTGVSW